MAFPMQLWAATEVYATSRLELAATPAPRTSKPSSVSRAIRTPMRLAMEVPVTNSPVALSGKEKIRCIHRAIWRSTSMGT